MSDNDLISSFRLAAEALEKLPQLQESHAQKEAELSKAQDDISRAAATIYDLQQTISDLKSQVRSLEVERDDAGFQELEAQEHLAALLRALSTITGTASTAVAEHTKPEVVEPNAAAEVEPKAQDGSNTDMLAEGPGIGHNSKESFDAAYEQLETTNKMLEDMAPKPSGLPPTKWRDDTGDASNPFIDEAIEASRPSGLPHDDAPTPSPTVIITSNASDGPVDEWHAPQIEEVTKPLPFLNTPAMDKPDSVSWKDFVSGGGRRPFWVTDEMMELGQSTSAA